MLGKTIIKKGKNMELSTKYLDYIKWMNKNAAGDNGFLDNLFNEKFINNIKRIWFQKYYSIHFFMNSNDNHYFAICNPSLFSFESNYSVYYLLKVLKLPLINRENGEKTNIDDLIATIKESNE
jgi:hypothetical protein